MKRRLLSLLLAVCMLFTMLPLQVFADTDTSERTPIVLPFTDVRKGDWFYDAVSYAYEHSLFNGTGNTTFSPNGTMTRAMYVTVIGRMVDIDVTKYQKKTAFSDVNAADYYAPYVAWAVELGITNGKGNGKFAPNDLVSREQMATFTVRLFDAMGYAYPESNVKTTPKDLSSVSDYAKDAVLKLWACGMLAGDSAGNVNPKSNATRAEAATFLMRTDKHLVDIGVKEYPVDTEEEVKKPKKPVKGSGTYTVVFRDGERYITALYATKGQPLTALPTSDKIAKDNAVFVGWYTDKALTTPFYKDDPVTSDMTVYAKYTDLQGQTISLTSFALIDQNPDLSFEIEKTADATEAPFNAFTLIPKDGSDLLPLKWTVEDNVYTVTADGGFNKGSSYELTLADGYNFKDKPDTIRTASFTIKMEEVDNLKMSDGIVYIKDTEDMDYEIGGDIYAVLTPSLVPETGGVFNYTNANELDEGDILCFYITTSPADRDYVIDSYNDDPEVYAKVEDISGTTVTFGALKDEDMTDLYKVPDNFPINVTELPTLNTGTVNISALDIATYQLILGADGTLEKARDSVDVGDFISLYVSADNVSDEDAVYFGEITAYDKATGEITFKKSSADAIRESMDLNVTPDIDGDDFISPEEKEEIEKQLYAQVNNSGFAQDAAFLLVDIATKTDGFRKMDSVQNVFLKDENGNPLSDEEIALLGIGKSFELSDDVKLTVELVTKGDKLRYKGGVQLAIGLEASFEVETADEGKIVIDLSAAFVEEVCLDIGVKGALVYKEILGFIPVPIGVKVSSNLDVKNFIAVSFNVNIYTVEKEDEDFWEKLEAKLKDSKVGPILNKIEEVESKIAEAKGTADQLLGYAEDVVNLWEQIEAVDGDFTREDYENICEELSKTNITQDLMDMMDLSTDTNVEVDEYIESLQALMEKYSEMLETETDWVKIVDKEMFKYEICLAGIAIQTSVSFVVRLDINMTMGSRLEYEVGKRYIVWFKIGLFKPSAGSETMDLLDERFAFQFYVMGKLGAKMGVALKISAGIGSAEIASVGITGEIGPYVKLYGFFIYEYEKMRPANTNEWEYKERMAGALYFEFGLYFILSFEAEALGLFEYSHDFIDEEYPLAHAGEKRYQYSFAYEPQPDEKVRIVDEDANSTTGITMKIPDSLLSLSYVDLNTGVLGSESYSPDNYSFSFSNPKFSIDENGVISVDVPESVQYIESDITITYIHKKLAFSKYDMSVTVPLVWTNLNDKELVEYFTASVRVGNDIDGYQTIWSDRLKKNEEFDLPSIDEVKKLINFSKYEYEGVNMKYENISDYSYPSKELLIFKDTTYDIDLTYKTYSVTVNGIENADGSKTSRTYTTQYGNAFDFSDLANTGTNKAGTYTKFATLTAEKLPEDIGNGELPTYDLTAPVEGKLALALSQGKVNPVATYVDDSINVNFEFMGIDKTAVVQKIKRGTEPNFAEIEEVVSDYGMALKDISPALGKLFTNTNYTVICAELTGPESTIFFEENGGGEVDNITKVVGSLIGTLPTPEKQGFNFDGWFTDADLTEAFVETKMSEANITLYAKWSVIEITVTLNASGGSFDGDENTRTLRFTYGEPYGTLPTPTRNGKGFNGWFTALEEGTKVTAETVMDKTNNHTLYAHWVDLLEIPKEALIISSKSETYQRGIEVKPSFNLSEEYEHLGLDSFSMEYRIQSDPNAEISVPINAGTYDVIVKRDGDGVYGYFEARYDAVVHIAKATRTISDVSFDVNKVGYIFIDIKPTSDIIDRYDISPQAKFTYSAMKLVGGLLIPSETSTSQPGASYIGDLMPATSYYVSVQITDDPNYHDTISGQGAVISTLSAPTESWLEHTEYFNPNVSEIEIRTPGQLAMLASEVRNYGLTFKDKTFKLMNDIDLTGYKWEPIGHPDGYLDFTFQGTFDGNGYTISGMYCNTTNSTHDQDLAGLFGLIYNGAVIKNVILTESFVKGNNSVGGIVALAYDNTTISQCINAATVVCVYQEAGGIAGTAHYAKIENCINTGRVTGSDTYGSFIGGIVGYASNKSLGGSVLNCVNYGTIGSAGYNTIGGIAGYNGTGIIANNINYGFVKGESTIGGIVGENNGDYAWVLNCYTTGAVQGTGEYIGAVVGRNYRDNGAVQYSYYLLGSATCNGAVRNGVGTEKSSLADGTKNEVAYFTSATSTLSRDAGYGTSNLLDALNDFVNSDQPFFTGMVKWVVGEQGYPVLEGVRG